VHSSTNSSPFAQRRRRSPSPRSYNSLQCPHPWESCLKILSAVGGGETKDQSVEGSEHTRVDELLALRIPTLGIGDLLLYSRDLPNIGQFVSDNGVTVVAPIAAPIASLVMMSRGSSRQERWWTYKVGRLSLDRKLVLLEILMDESMELAS